MALIRSKSLPKKKLFVEGNIINEYALIADWFWASVTSIVKLYVVSVVSAGVVPLTIPVFVSNVTPVGYAREVIAYVYGVSAVALWFILIVVSP